MGRPKNYDRDEVLNKAAFVFWKKGFADTSLQDLEKATGVNKSGLYAEFKDKDGLYVSSLEHYLKTTDAISLLRREPLGWNNIFMLLTGKNPVPGIKGCLIINSMRESAIIPSLARKSIHKYLESLRSAFVDNLKAEGFHQDAELKADLIFTFNVGLALRANGAPSDFDPKDHVDQFLCLLGRK